MGRKANLLTAIGLVRLRKGLTPEAVNAELRKLEKKRVKELLKHYQGLIKDKILHEGG